MPITINIISSIMSAFVFAYINKVLNKVDRNIFLYKTSQYALVIGSAIFASTFINQILIKISLINLTLFICNKLIYKTKTTHSIIYAVFSYFIFMIGDIVSGFILMCILNYNLLEIQNTNILWLLSNSLTIIITVSIISIKFIKEVLTVKETPAKQELLIVIYAIITVLLFDVLLLMISRLPEDIVKNIISTYVAIFLLYFIITTLTFHINNNLAEERFKYEQKNRQYEHLMLYTELVDQLVMNFRKFRHDFNNIMATLNGYFENNDIEGLKEFYNKEILREYGKIDITDDISYINHIKNPAIRGVLSTKMVYAMQLGVEFKISILQDIDDMQIKTIDICRILGILLDNAIEEAMNTEDKIVSFGIMEDNQEISLVVSNTFKDKPQINKIFTNSYSTKGVNRGMGLKILKEIIKSYHNVIINTLIDENLFVQEIIINKTLD
ncbi:sensor histidine kinase [Alkaliphilus sp. B6464]|uniref:sensor histidine kinase n=1 Tax=Alkaliphilus sp. B6464 TaxID=2731219 RepID=UPI001BA96144|nr:GHKL domain-containing protein [Alkaliphilus sp. B6464]QUH21912.1 GHKL domain-containing protein [Alkaliphilus sp. B6464]